MKQTILTQREVAAILGITTAGVRCLRRKGKIGFFRDAANRPLFHLEEVRRFAGEHGQGDSLEEWICGLRCNDEVKHIPAEMMEMVRSLASLCRQKGIGFEGFEYWARQAYLLELLHDAQGNISRAARLAGLHRNTFARMIVAPKKRPASARLARSGQAPDSLAKAG